MEMDYNQQLLLKQHIIEENLKRIGGFESIKVLPTLGMNHPYRYRNKGQYPIAIQKQYCREWFLQSTKSRHYSD